MFRGKISCIIPAYNEEMTVGQLVRTIKSLRDDGLDIEIIVVSDGSTDRTSFEAKKAGAKVINLSQNIGKGGSLINGIKRANGEIIVTLDADLLNFQEEHFRQIIEPIISRKADVVVGYLANDKIQNLLPHFSGQRAFRKEILEKILDDKKFLNSGYQFELLCNQYIQRNNLKTIFVPLYDLDHLRKEVKYPLHQAYLKKIRFIFDLVRTFNKQFYFISITTFAIILIYFSLLAPLRSIQANFSDIRLPQENEKILVIIAHPDDEIIGAGGFIYDILKNKESDISIVYVTNGDVNKFSASILNKKIILKKNDYVKEGEKRYLEAKKVLNLLGVKKAYFLSFPDRELKYLLSDNWSEPLKSKYTGFSKSIYDFSFKKNIPYTGENLKEILKEIILDLRPRIIITHSSQDYNSDHSTVNYFVNLIIDELVKSNTLEKPKIYSFLVHWKFLEFPRPFHYAPNKFLTPPKELANNCNWQSYFLSEEAEKIKTKSIKIYQSQLEDPYLNLLLHSFIRKNELFCVF